MGHGQRLLFLLLRPADNIDLATAHTSCRRLQQEDA